MSNRMIGSRRAIVREVRPGVRLDDGQPMTGDYKIVLKPDVVEFYFDPALSPARAALIMLDKAREIYTSELVPPPFVEITHPAEVSV